MVRLLLLDAQVEDFPGATVIESDPAYYKRLAMEAHAAWLADPSSLAKKREYGHALLRWAKQTRNRGAKTYARKLLGETA